MEPQKRPAATTVKNRCDSYTPGGQQTRNLGLEPLKGEKSTFYKSSQDKGSLRPPKYLGEYIQLKKVP